MTAPVAQVRLWSAAGLDVLAVRLGAAGRVLAEAGGAAARARPPGSWRGAAADAARAAHDRLTRLVEDLVAEVAAVRTGFAAAADAVSGLSAGLAAAQELADRNGFTIAVDGTVVDGAGAPAVVPADGGARAAVRAEIVVRLAQVGRAAGELDAELAAVLGAVAAGAGPPAPGIRPPAPPDGGAGGVAAGAGWWAALSPAAQGRVVAEHPEWVGNRDGLPAAARDAANRRLLAEETARLAADLRSVQARFDALTAAGPGPIEAGWLAARDELLGRAAELRRRQEVVAAVAGAAAGADRELLLLDLDRRRPRAAVAAGDVDTAEHVAVLTLGFGTTVGDDLARVVDTAGALRDRSAALLDGAGSVATVAWLGYDAPGGPLTVSTSAAARRGGSDLAHFLDGVDAARRTDPHLTALGHSYGSLTTGYALREAQGVDDAVLLGSPGIGTDDVGDLHVPAGHTDVVEAPWDPVADLGWFGDDPNRLPGVTGLSARAATLPDGTASAGSVLHNQYLSPGTTSQYNIAATVAGLPDRRVLDRGVGVGDVLREGIGP